MSKIPHAYLKSQMKKIVDRKNRDELDVKHPFSQRAFHIFGEQLFMCQTVWPVDPNPMRKHRDNSEMTVCTNPLLRERYWEWAIEILNVGMHCREMGATWNVYSSMIICSWRCFQDLGKTELSSSVVTMSNHIYPSDCNTYIIGSVQQPELQMDSMITAKLISAQTCIPETVPCCYLK